MSLQTFKTARFFGVFAAIGVFSGCSMMDETPEPEGERIACAIGEGVEMSEVCSLEKIPSGGADMFLLHHPDGGFRRITFDLKSLELGVADGADTLRISGQSSDDATEFTIGLDRYRIANELIRQPETTE